MRAITLGLFLFGIFLISTPVAYSYSSDVVLDENNQVLFVEAQANNNDGLHLIPTTAILKNNDTKYYTYKYTVEVSEGLEFSVEIDDLYVNSSREFSEQFKKLFNVDISYREIKDEQIYPYQTSNGTKTYEVFVILTMNEPESKEEYLLVTQNDITVEFMFKAV